MEILYVSPERELSQSNYLIEKIKSSGFIDNNTIIVNCSPEYSSRLVQLVNHKLSYLNHNELYEVINLELPKANMSQVWDENEKTYPPFDKYLSSWINKHIDKSFKYLFVTSSIFRGKNLNKVKLLVKSKLEPDQYRFTSLYLSEESILVPDFYITKTNNKPVFFWENTNL